MAKSLILFVKLLYIIFKVNGYLVSIVPERPQVECVNPKYLEHVSILRVRRNSPYIVNVTFFPKVEIGDNISFEAVVMERLSNGYQPTLMRIKNRFCVFLNKEIFFGKMISKQFPPNVSCPLRKNVQYSFCLQSYPVEIPFMIPFTFSSNWMKGRVDFSVFTTVTKETVARAKYYVSVNSIHKNIK